MHVFRLFTDTSHSHAMLLGSPSSDMFRNERRTFYTILILPSAKMFPHTFAMLATEANSIDTSCRQVQF